MGYYKYEYNLTDKETFWWLQLVHAIPKLWVAALNKDLLLSINFAIYDLNLIKKCQLYILSKLVSKELYNISLCSLCGKLTSQIYCEKLLGTTNLNWKEIYILPRKVSMHTNLRMFQFKILNNILFINKLLFKFKKVPSPMSFSFFATLQIKRHCMSSMLVILQINYGTNFNIFFLSIFIFLKLLHRVASLGCLISAISNKIFY